MFVQPVEVMNTIPQQVLGPLAGLNTLVSDFHLCVFVLKIIFSIFCVFDTSHFWSAKLLLELAWLAQSFSCWI